MVKRKDSPAEVAVPASTPVDNVGLVRTQTILVSITVVLGLMVAFTIGFNVGVKVGSGHNHNNYDYPYYYDYPPMVPPYAYPGDFPVSSDGGVAEGLRLPYQPGDVEVITGDEAVE